MDYLKAVEHQDAYEEIDELIDGELNYFLNRVKEKTSLACLRLAMTDEMKQAMVQYIIHARLAQTFATTANDTGTKLFEEFVRQSKQDSKRSTEL